ncbi:DsbA family protein [Terricaulis sp.]|uniref:DsbA family protein n=1 Tax=Terricaulis sp. TaxID=2768686 RepID=UPI003783124A
MALGRRELLLGAAGVALVGGSVTLAACNPAGGGTGTSPDDMILGEANAPATLIEYASATCPHCAEFHHEVWDQLKANYIDTGKLRYIFREYPTPPEAVAVAGFQLARCGGASPEQYMNRVGEIFRQQRDIFASGTMEGIRGKFVEIGGAAGLSEEQVMQCITDQSGADRVRRVVEASRPFNVTGTPTLILNGTKIEDPRAVTYEGLSQIIDAALAQHS